MTELSPVQGVTDPNTPVNNPLIFTGGAGILLNVKVPDETVNLTISADGVATPFQMTGPRTYMLGPFTPHPVYITFDVTTGVLVSLFQV